jgi:hypothetical protein
MNLEFVSKQYDFTGKTVAVTGGAGVLCGVMAATMTQCPAC